jgi:DNA-binding IclR family transcriptional regulator
VRESVSARLLAILAAFDERHRSLTLSELARSANLPPATAHRLVGELARWGALERRPTGEYVVGRRLWELGLLAPEERGLRRTAEPFLHDLHAATRATVHLAVREGHEALYLDRVSGNASVPIVSKVGSRLPLHATGVGKMLLAHAPDDVVAWVLAHLVRITSHTVTQPGRLRVQLDRARREGYAQSVEEMSLGACSVAVPVRSGNQVVAALGVVVPELRRSTPRLVAALEVAAHGIGRRITPPDPV